MAIKKSKTRSFCGMSYRDVQRSNSARRQQLPKEKQQWLKENGYQNVGWNNVIRLYEKLNDLLALPELDEPTLEELFLQAERIGGKYQTPEEQAEFQKALQVEVEAIAEKIDQQFPDEETEYIDFSHGSRRQ